MCRDTLFACQMMPLRLCFGGLQALAKVRFSSFVNRYELENENKEDSDECKELGKKFRLFHGLSSFVNLGALIGSVVYAWELASMLPA